MPENITIFLDIDEPERHKLIAEQLVAFSHYRVSPSGNNADLLLCDSLDKASKANMPSVYINRDPLRLGDIIDKVHYAIAKRDDHIESAEALLIGPFKLLPYENILLHVATNQPIPLTDKERQLIRGLYEAPSHRMSRMQLLQTVWRYADNTETHTFETHLYRLRQKLEPYDAAWLVTSVGDGEFTLCSSPPQKVK